LLPNFLVGGAPAEHREDETGMQKESWDAGGAGLEVQIGERLGIAELAKYSGAGVACGTANP
jgi:hypothetical protein